MEEFKRGEIVLFKDYTEETDWQVGFYIEYDKEGYEGKHHRVSIYLTQINENTFAIDKYKGYRRYVKKLPYINFGNGVIWGKEEEEHAN